MKNTTLRTKDIFRAEPDPYQTPII